MAARPLKVAVLGATGAAGRALLQALEEGDLPVGSLRLLASARSAGTELEFRGEPRRVEVAGEGALRGVDVVFLAAGAAASREWAPRAAAEGALAVDLSPAFRADAGVPLVLPAVNGEALARLGKGALVALPGPAAAHLALALAPLHRAAGVERASVTVLAAASGAGQRGVEELEAEVRALLSFQEPPPPTALAHRVAFNVVPQAGAFADDGASEEERALAAEVKRLLGSSLRVAATVVRVPVFYGHAQAVNIRTRRKLAAAEARELLRGAPHVKVVDAPTEGVYPMPMLAVNDEAVLVGRVREDATQENGLDLFLAADNLRQGGASALAVATALAERVFAAS
jgi:aspartate-semialdehyde dehydrogenase